MINFAEEQENEIQALEAIYPNELEVVSKSPETRFTIAVRTDQSYDEEDDEYEVTLLFGYTKRYPEEVPSIQVEDSKNVDESDESELIEHLTATAEQSTGMVMVFILVSEALEWLNRRKDELKLKRVENEERLKKEKEEAEFKRFEGTRVTVETFLAWKQVFDKEMAFLRKDQIARDALMSKKPTGRELFEKDKTLIESDLQFLEDGDVAQDLKGVVVDESLFEDLNIEDDED
jgi:hypothetical protein